MLLIDAIYINTSGGKVLLEHLLSNLSENTIGIDNSLIILDKRLKTNLINKFRIDQIKYSDGNESARKKVYQIIFKEHVIKSVFCFGNVPPPHIAQRSNVFIYFHNMLLIDSNIKLLSIFQILKYTIKKFYIIYKNKKEYNWIVQTNLIEKKLKKAIFINSKVIHVLPIFNSYNFSNNSIRNSVKKNNKFVYIASGNESKNHKILFDTWKILAVEFKVFPELHLTLDASYSNQIEKIKLLQKTGIKIYNHGLCDQTKVQALYKDCDYLIFPSLLESFGLPLIEAAIAGCIIMASELPFVYEVVKPSITFDPLNANEIANKIYLLLLNENVLPTELLVADKTNELIKLINLN